jgi:hypothetical protein
VVEQPAWPTCEKTAQSKALTLAREEMRARWRTGTLSMRGGVEFLHAIKDSLSSR